jgi:hypothetical protein
MFTSNFFILIRFIILLLFFSCNNNQYNDKVKANNINSVDIIQIDTTLTELKKEIQISIDSANVYFDNVLMESEKSIENREKIIEDFSRKKTHYEITINNALDKVNKLGQEGKISKKEAESWLKEFDLTMLLAKYNKIKSLK